MKKNLLAIFLMLSLFACHKKAAETLTQTPQKPMPVEQQAKPVEVSTKGVINIPQGISADLLVSLERTPCFGRCPSFKVEIFKEGSVKYNGRGYAKRLGNFTAKVDAAFIARLQEQATAVKYLNFNAKYPVEGREIVDVPTTITYMRLGNEGKMVTNNFDAPKELVAFERWLETQVEGLTWQAVKE